ncbi:MAG: tetratricopeptide repeat protein [Bacteroidales bacterium]|nr:tetratricopeptide repeat protein [Bacteroidales bacterium]
MRKFWFLFILLFSVQYLFAQNNQNKSQLAYQYFKDKEFDRAAILYKELYDESHSKTYLNYLIKCYTSQRQFEIAEDILKRELKKDKRDVNLIVALGGVYQLSGEKEKAEKLFLKTIDQLGDSRTDAINLANAFISQQEFGYAEQTYLKAKKLSKGQYSYTFELANVYYYARQYDKMIDQYLDLLSEGDQYIQSVQNRLQAVIYNQDDGSLNQLLKDELIRRIQKEKDSQIYSELLIWLYLQEKNFKAAYRQTVAIDKRNKEQGDRLIALGEMALNNNDYEVASECFEYVIQLGAHQINYLDANIGYLKSMFQQIEAGNYSQKELDKLIDTYQNFLMLEGNNDKTAIVKIDYATILAFYQQQPDKAIALLEDITIATLPPNIQSKIKLSLADILLFDDRIWEATLYYSQVIKSNPNNELGNEAQLKKAKLAYYSGDFLWAKGQLDVLKASTSKLISNDAFYWSSVVADNYETENDAQALNALSQIDYLMYQKKYTEALSTIDSAFTTFPKHAIEDDLWYRKGQILNLLSKDDEALAAYRTIVEKYYDDLLADNALMAMADIYWFSGQHEKAVELYTQLLVDFPDSFFSNEARQRIVEFRDS